MQDGIGSCREYAFFAILKQVSNTSLENSGSPSGSGDDELHQALTLNRQLKAMIVEMRISLDNAQAEKADAVQAAVAASRDEIRLLQDTIQTLREEMQATEDSKAGAVQETMARGKDETQQLQETIATLRAELEKTVFLHADELEKQARMNNDELRQLRETISSLRTLLEKNHAS